MCRSFNVEKFAPGSKIFFVFNSKKHELDATDWLDTGCSLHLVLVSCTTGDRKKLIVLQSGKNSDKLRNDRRWSYFSFLWSNVHWNSFVAPRIEHHHHTGLATGLVEAQLNYSATIDLQIESLSLLFSFLPFFIWKLIISAPRVDLREEVVVVTGQRRNPVSLDIKWIINR